MLRDVFYLNNKPNVHPRERFAESVDDARQKSTTEHFWIINEFCEYHNFDWDFDFEFLPDEDVWAENHNNVWPSQHQKDSGTWLCPKEHSDLIIYRSDVDPVIRKNEKTARWVELDKIDHTKFDFSWHPDITDPPYIYKWGSKFAPVQLKSCLEYHVENATTVKYMSNIVELLPETDRWIEHQLIDESKFDMSWRPDPLDPILNYVWGNKYIDGRLKPTLEYHVSDSVDTKYMPDLISVFPEWDKWVEHQLVDRTKFDFSWRPDPREPAYIYTWGNKYIDGIQQPTVEYHCPGATERKYMTNDVEVLPKWDRWVEVQAVDKNKFDFSWRPDPREPAYIYTWGNKYIDGIQQPTVEYHCPGATERKYMTNDVEVLPEWDRWVEVQSVDKNKFDMSWRPDPREPSYIYTWGNKYIDAEIIPTLEYHCPGATERKYMTNDVVVLPEWDKWQIPSNIDRTKFDMSWRPDPREPAYIYTWGNKYIDAEIIPTLEYHCEGATERKYMTNDVVVLPEWDKWQIPSNIDRTKFDFSWRPDPREPVFIYAFATVWNNRGGPTYTAPNATEYKYVEDVKAKLLPSKDNWEINDIDVSTFDFSWVPHPEAPPYIYQFGTLEDATNGPRYVSPNNDGIVVKLNWISKEHTEQEVIVSRYYIETTLDDLIKKHPNELFWAMHKNIDYSTFDFSWRPEIVETAYQLDYVHVFGSTESELTQTYFVSGKNYLAGKTSFNFIEGNTKLDEKTLFKIFNKADMFYIDRGNIESQARFDALKLLHPKIQKTRYLNSWVDTIKRCVNRATSELVWVLNSELDYSDFDFEYYPNPWQMKMVNVFGTQWSHWGSTFLVNRETFAEDTKYINIIEHLSNLNFVKTMRAKATECVYDTIVVDHGNKELDNVIRQITAKTSGKNVTVVKYNDSYLQTIKDIVTSLPEKKEHYLWLCSSVCDYSSFDFSYMCDPFARDNLHVFASGKQKFGDTFLVDVNKTKEIIYDMSLLEDYPKVNYNGVMKVNRLPEPIIVTTNDTSIEAIMHIEDFPYATITTSDNENIDVAEVEPMNLWAPETKNILVTSTGATRITVPYEAKEYVKKELYDYPYIKRAAKLAVSSPMDIVYLSNGETGAEENWEHLQEITKDIKNRVVRVDGVNGRVQAYHAALEASETPWAFTVFAKLKIDPKFDWSWQPDRMQIAKHYIFYAKNPVNGLIYGHQGLICYNKKLTLANSGKGLDFTLDDEHEVVPLLSGIANYNTDEFSTWRTSFREVLKLKAEDSDIARTRLDAWLNNAEGKFSQYSIKGAIDATEYYDKVGGDFNKLKLSYEWAWLKERFDKSKI